MARNKLTDLNDHLFAQIEKMSDEETPADNDAIRKAEAIAKLADQIVKTHKLVLDAARLTANLSDEERKALPESFGINKKTDD